MTHCEGLVKCIGTYEYESCIQNLVMTYEQATSE